MRYHLSAFFEKASAHTLGGGGGGVLLCGDAPSKRGNFLGFMYHKSSVKPPNKPSLYRGSKLISPPPPYLLFTDK